MTCFIIVKPYLYGETLSLVERSSLVNLSERLYEQNVYPFAQASRASYVNGSLRFARKSMNSVGSPMQCSLGRRVILPPMTTFLHINRALDVFGAIIVALNEKETLLIHEVRSAEKY